jgi:hypothetical protein
MGLEGETPNVSPDSVCEALIWTFTPANCFLFRSIPPEELDTAEEPNVRTADCLSVAALHFVLDLLDFATSGTAISRANSVRMLDLCWISPHVEHVFASWRPSKVGGVQLSVAE